MTDTSGRSASAARNRRGESGTDSPGRALTSGFGLSAGVVVVVLAVIAALGWGLTDWLVRPTGGLALFGAVGLAAHGGIEELTAKIERFEAGEAVDFSPPRDDEVGRLYEAVGRLAASARGDQGEGFPRRLCDVATDTDLDDDEQAARILDLGRDRLGVGAGLVVTVDESADEYDIDTAVGDVDTDRVSGPLRSLCRETVGSDGVVDIADTSEAAVEASPSPGESGPGCYIGDVIRVDDDCYGVVCFVGRDSRTPFSGAERSDVTLLSQWLSHVCERRERLRDLEESEARYRAIVESARVAILTVDTDDVIRFANPAVEDIFGYAPSELVGQQLTTLMPERFHDSHRAALTRFLDTGERQLDWSDIEFPGLRADGEVIDLHISFSTYEHDGERYFQGILRDRTEQKERERDLEATRERMEFALDATDSIIYDVDLESGRETRHGPFERLYGIESDELETSRAFFEHGVHPEDRDRVEDPQRVANLESLSDSIEFEYRTHPDHGSVRWLRSEAYVRRGPDGDPEHLVGLATDVTDRKERERELEREREWREAIFNGSRDAIFISDADARFVDVNDAAAALTGYERAELLSMRIPDLHDETDLEAYQDYHDRILSGEAVTTEADLLRADGSKLPVEFSNRRIEVDGDVYMHTVARDITERKERERALERYREYTDRILDAIDDLFFVLDESGSLRRWNDRLAEVTDYADDEIASMAGPDFVPDDYSERTAAAIREVFETGSARLEAPLLTKDGETIPYEFVANRVEGPDGEPQLVGIGRDISGRKERERELRRERDRLATLFENLPNPVLYGVTVDGDHVVRRVNPAFEEAFGYSQDDIEGEEGTALIVPEERRQRADERLDRAIEEGTVSTEVVRETPEGRREFRLDVAVRNPEADRPERYTVYTDITDQKERERELERTRELLRQAGRIAGVGGWELDARSDPPEMTWSDEVYRIHDLPPEETVTVSDGVDFYHPEDRQRVRECVERALEDGEGYDIEARLITATGTERWVRSIGEPVERNGDVVAVRGSIQDITEGKERELALESLHEVTRGLLETETDEAAADLVVDAATGTLGLDSVGVYLLDSESNELDPVAYTDPLTDAVAEVDAVGAGSDSPVWDCFVSGTPTVLDGSDIDRWEQANAEVAGGLLVPVGDHGVFLVVTDEPSVDEGTRRLVETLVATAEAAFDRIETETSLRERDAQLEARNRRLRQQIQINDIIREVDQSLVEAGSRGEIEAAVCDRLVTAEDIAFAWIGGLDAAGDRLDVREWAGTGEAYLDAVSLATDAGDEPAVETARTTEPTVVSNVLADPDRSGWRADALAAGFHSVVSVPLAFEGITYGVLTVYADQPEVFGGLERTVFAELGENIANSINAVETQQALHADTLVELTLALDAGDDFLGRVAREAGCVVTYEGLATHTDEGTRLFFRTAGVRSDAVRTVLESLVEVREFQLVTEGGDSGDTDAALFEATVTGAVVAAHLVRHGGSPRSMTASPDGTEVVVAVPRATDIREFVEMLRTPFPSVELAGRRTVERSAHTRQELVASLLDSLTDRQREVLRTAYHAGFFEWPRTSTGEDVAAMLGVTQPTVNRHIRIGQQRLFAQLFDEGDAELTRGDTVR